MLQNKTKQFLLIIFSASLFYFSPVLAKDSASVFQKIETTSCQLLPGKEFAISFQVGMNFKTIQMMMPPKTKTWKSYDCSGQKAGVIVYEFASSKEAENASAFIKGNIWGTTGPTPQHPERIYTGGNLVVIVSSTQKNALDDAIVQSLK